MVTQLFKWGRFGIHWNWLSFIVGGFYANGTVMLFVLFLGIGFDFNRKRV